MDFCFGFVASSAGNCIFRFTEQPVIDARCRIYDVERVELRCTVSSKGSSIAVFAEDPSDVSIRWYHNNGTEHQLRDGINVTKREGGNGVPIVVTSTLGITARAAANSVPIAEGSYYCRVEVIPPPESDIAVEPNSSQPFTVPIYDPTYFDTMTRCANAEFISQEITCAVLSVTVDPTMTSSESSISTTLPATTTSSTNGDPTISTGSTLDDGNQSTELSKQPSPDENGGDTLQVWIYVLVAVAAVFAMIIIILAIMCVGLCLRRSQTMDTNSLKRKLPNTLSLSSHLA